MPDFRAYAPGTRTDATEIRLSPDESHHLVTVNRCGRGDPVTVFDGHGLEWLTICADPSKSATVLSVKQARLANPLPYEITLAQAMPKGATMDDIVRQATEIGAARVIPLFSERTQVHFDVDRANKKTEKWRTAAVEAAKQCGTPWIPEITSIKPYLALLTAVSEYDLKLIASLHQGATTLKYALTSFVDRNGCLPRRVIWLVGPEGDFSPIEVTAALSAGFVPVTLGPLVLRSDTAAVYALSILSHELQSSFTL
jgi:16S rRNA (uracil1498-N3)-methyltransferase